MTSSTRALPIPERVRLSLSSEDPRPSVPLDLASRRLWPLGLLFGAFFAGFAWIALSQLGSLRAQEVETVFDLTFVLFQGFWILGWSAGVLLLFGLTVLFLFYDENARLTASRLVYVPRLGPLRVFMEYDLRQIRNLRLEEKGGEGRVRLRFDYGGGTVSLGNDLLRSRAERTSDAIREAIAEVGASESSRDQAIAKSAMPPGFDVTRWLRKRASRSGTGSAHGRGSRGEHESVAEVDEGESTGTRGGVRGSASPVASGSAGDAAAPSWTSPSVLSLLAANLVPLGGVLFLGWDLGEVMVLFWAENGIIGFYTLLRMVFVAGWSVLFLGPFFVGHFGGFMAGHFLFIYALFVQGGGLGPSDPAPVSALGDLLGSLWPALTALFVSHGVSFYTNFVRGREYQGRTTEEQMKEPYKRVVVLHVTIILGGWVILALGTPVAALVLLVGLKTAVDLRAHRKEHRRR